MPILLSTVPLCGPWRATETRRAHVLTATVTHDYGRGVRYLEVRVRIPKSGPLLFTVQWLHGGGDYARYHGLTELIADAVAEALEGFRGGSHL